MKLSNLEILNSINMLDKFCSAKLPQRISYAITRNMMILQKEYVCYEKELQKLMEKYQDNFIKDEDGNIRHNESGVPMVEDSASPDFYADLSALLSIEIDVDIFTIPEELFDYDDGRYDTITARDILMLQKLLCSAE